MNQKRCTKCGVEYLRTKEFFPSVKKRKDGLSSWCRKCDNAASADWRKKNLRQYRNYYKTFRGYISHLVASIKQRCTNSKHLKYKYYGGRGIKCRFTSKELYDWLVVKNIDPRELEIHRMDNNGNYTLDNIEFLTGKEHRQLQRK